MAPCCWTKNVAEHDSQAAQDMRARIDAMVQAGRTDDEIKTALVGAYGRRIQWMSSGCMGPITSEPWAKQSLEPHGTVMRATSDYRLLGTVSARIFVSGSRRRSTGLA